MAYEAFASYNSWTKPLASPPRPGDMEDIFGREQVESYTRARAFDARSRHDRIDARGERSCGEMVAAEETRRHQVDL